MVYFRYKGYGNGVPVAIKVVDFNRFRNCSDKTLLHHLQSEVQVMMSVHHRNIVTLHETILSPECNTLYLVLEYCNNGDMETYIKKRGPLCENEARFFMEQLACGLLELHNKNIMHRDLKVILSPSIL